MYNDKDKMYTDKLQPISERQTITSNQTYSRNLPFEPLLFSLSMRAGSNRRTLFPTGNDTYVPAYTGGYNIVNEGTPRGHFIGYSVDLESELHHRKYAIQHSNSAYYVPSSESSMFSQQKEKRQSSMLANPDKTKNLFWTNTRPKGN